MLSESVCCLSLFPGSLTLFSLLDVNSLRPGACPVRHSTPYFPVPRTGPDTKVFNCYCISKALNVQGCAPRGRAEVFTFSGVHSGIQVLPTFSCGPGSHINIKSVGYLLMGSYMNGIFSSVTSASGDDGVSNRTRAPFMRVPTARTGLWASAREIRLPGIRPLLLAIPGTPAPPNMWSFLLQGGGPCFRDSAALSCGQAILVPRNALLLGADSRHLCR